MTAARDRAKAAGLLDKGVELAAENPAAAAGEIHFVFRDLLALAMTAKDYDRAASLVPPRAGVRRAPAGGSTGRRCCSTCSPSTPSTARCPAWPTTSGPPAAT